MFFLAVAQPDIVCPISRNTYLEDRVCALVQCLGLLLVLGGVATQVALAGVYGSATAIVAFSIYGATLILMYAFSFAYHASREPRHKRVLRLIDHSTIYLLIAGTYTPFMLVAIGGDWGWSIFGVVWGLALLGIALKLLFKHRLKFVSIGLYLAMGWLIIVTGVPLERHMEWNAIIWMTMAGLAYTLGVPVYLLQRLPFNHAVWHLFVFSGSLIFYFVLMFHVLLA